LKFVSFRSLPANRFLLAAFAGLMLSAAFPGLELAGLAWIGPAFLLASALGKRGWESFRIGYVGGLTFYLAALYWLLYIPYRWHGIPLGPAAGWLALSSYLALYPATWVWVLANGLKGSRSFDDTVSVGSPPGSVERLPDLLPGTWAGRALWALCGAALWVALEMVVARLFSGFPWLLLGITQYRLIPLIQIASVTGVYGVSFLIVWGSLSILLTGAMLLRRSQSPSMRLAEMFIPFVVIAIVFQIGFRQVKEGKGATRTLKVTFVQPSIPQTLIWDQTRNEERFQHLISLSRQALTNRTDLLLWPEAAIPKLLRYDKSTFETVTGLAREHKVWMIVGADDAEPRRDSEEHADYFNSSFLISPDGELVQGYKKRGLVIFGEYIPLERWLPFMKYFTPIPGGFQAGDRAAQFALSNLQVNTSPLICFEDVFPQWARECTKPETDFLVNLTNDGWFGESAEPWQHAASSVFRSVENRVPLLRCTNTGLTCWVDALGRLRQIFRDHKASVYGPGFMTAEIPLAGSVDNAQTFYNQKGDWFGWVCVIIAGGMVLGTLHARRKARLQDRETPHTSTAPTS
jgi:apolipoprotein N-acyltransferase